MHIPLSGKHDAIGFHSILVGLSPCLKIPQRSPSVFGQHEIFPLAAMGPEKEVDRTLKGETIY
jgi:hypothetical protein